LIFNLNSKQLKNFKILKDGLHGDFTEAEFKEILREFLVNYKIMLVRTRSLSNVITFFRDNLLGAQTYRGHDVDFTRSRGVIGHVTI